MAFRWGATPRDAVALEGIYTSGDANGITDGKYGGVVTGNTWGAPGALLIGHGAYLLMPHAFVVNRFYAAITDPSNVGFGISAATLNASWDVVPCPPRSGVKPLPVASTFAMAPIIRS